jgi:hypothetical protein
MLIKEALFTAFPQKTGKEVYADEREEYLNHFVWSKCSSPEAAVRQGKEPATPDMRSSRAIEKWLRVDSVHNKKTNLRLQEYLDDAISLVSSHNGTQWQWCPTRSPKDKYLGFAYAGQILSLARRYVAGVMGDVDIFLDRIPSLIEYSNGASTRVRKGAVAIAEKFQGQAHCTKSARGYLQLLVESSEMWYHASSKGDGTEEVMCSSMFTVPKSADIDRVACKEPEGNMLLQRAVGNWIRRKLRPVGVDLNDQTRNQRLAKLGAESGKLATIDLSSASDTVSFEVVRLLLPPEWFSLLCEFRVGSVKLPDGAIHQMEMFSTMGNGFTFELESLIFWALTRATSYLLGAKGTISVYGDDIICPTTTAVVLMRIVLPFFGFIPNTAKSHYKTSDIIRESCGKHYARSRDITPFFIRRLPECTMDVIQIANQLSAWLTREEGYHVFYPALVELWGLLSCAVSGDLWGGQDFEDVSSLVTGHPPRKKLVKANIPNKAHIAQMNGAYVWWLFKTRDSLDVNRQEFSPTESASDGRWVKRPNRSWYDSSIRHFFMMAVCERKG